ncbi:MFS transporter [Hydrogenobacter thermophilus]|uniref:MFS transporter n=1 Tax=Hydrogenobacter thermophilus TaxID=940 RepID=UPI0030F64974
MRRIIHALMSGNPKALFASFLYFDTGFSIWLLLGALAPFIVQELNLSPAQKGFMVAVPVLSAAVFRLNFGHMYQSIDGKRIALMGIILSGIPSLFALLFPQLLSNYTVLLLLGVILGLGGASFAVALPMAGSNYPREVQGLVLGLAAAGNIGAVLDGILFPPLAKVFGWKETMAMAGILLIITFFVVFLWAKDKGEKEGSPYHALGLFFATQLFLLILIPGLYNGWFGIKGKEALLLLPLIGSSFVFAFLPNKYRKVLLERDTWLMILIYSITFGGFVGMSSYVSLYLIDQYAFSKLSAGALMSLFAFTGAFIRPFGGYIADRISGVRALLFILAGISGVYMLLSLLSLPPFLGILALLVIFAFFGLGNGATFQLVPQRWPKARGIMAGLIGAAGGFGGFYLPTVLGMVKEATGSYSAGFFLFSMIALIALALLKLVHSQWMEWAYVRYDYEKDMLTGIAPNGRVAMELVYKGD